MTNRADTEDLLLRFVKARIPFVACRTAEQQRALSILRSVAERIQIPLRYHTQSRGIRDVESNVQVADARTVEGALDWAAEKFTQQDHVTLVLTDVQQISDDSALSRQVLDLAHLATERGGMIITVTPDPIWSPLQRLGMSVTLDPPDEGELAEIIEHELADYRGTSGYAIEWDQDDVAEAASVLSGVTALEAQNVVASFLVRGGVSKADLPELRHVKDRIFSDISGIERVRVDADYQVGGLEGLQTWLSRERELLTAPQLRERKMRPPRGVLLVGVPGCGKSLSAKLIASSWDLPLYRLDLANMHGQYLGQSESRFKSALEAADHMAPCVLWVDEIEKGLAGGNDGGTSTRLIGHFLYWLQESLARVFVVATANDVSRLPPELLRRGRFDELFFVDLPDEGERGQIIDIYAKQFAQTTLEEHLRAELVQLSEGFAGSDIAAAVRDVAKDEFLLPGRPLTDETWQRAFHNVVPLSRTSPEQIEGIRAWGRDRAVPASGKALATNETAGRRTRAVLT